MAENIITILDDLSQNLGVPVITPEYEIVLTLLDQPELTAQALLARSSLSSTGFFATLDRLKHLNVIQSEACHRDKRLRLYSLEPAMADLIISRFGEYQQSHISFPTLHLQERELRAQSQNVRRGEKIDHLSAEYQVLLYMYLWTDITNSQLITLVDASPSKINSTLKELSDKGLIFCTTDETDRRRKRYKLADSARRAIDNSHARVFDWLDTVKGNTRGVPLT